jgi:GH15 family glucan-1,4-alpha-glucosidase
VNSLLLKDYGIIGNLNTCALINREGNVDWCCFPHMESPSVFAGILDSNKGGQFVIQPNHSFQSAQRYKKDTNVLETFFFAVYGDGKLTDFMPIRTKLEEKPLRQAIYRKLECLSGRVVFKMEFSPKFNYGRGETQYRTFEGGVEASFNRDSLYLYSPWSLAQMGDKIVTQNWLKRGETVWFLLRYNHDYRDSDAECNQELNRTLNYWQTWAHERESSAEAIFRGPAREIASRSGLILKLLMNADTGSIAAAATTSIPEQIGGERNWDYRFNWVRDSSFTVQALYHLGHPEEAKKHLTWFTQVCKKQVDPVKIQPLYALNSDEKLVEEELHNLEGYRDSRPVRIGNLASDQLQLDVFGELVNAFYETTRYGLSMNREDWDFVRRVVEHVRKIWSQPDSGIWEARTEPRHYVYSKVMCWVALDRAIKIATVYHFDAPLDDWKKTMEDIRTSILQNGFNEKMNSFVQYYGSEALDATGLLIPILGFLPADDPKIQGTIKAIKEKLGGKDYLLYRYHSDDGLQGTEGKFFLCSFWLVQALALAGQVEEAEKVLFSMLKYVSPTGIISEEVDTETGELLGNFPQAFSHIGMINSLIYLYKAKGKPKALSIIGTPEFNTLLIEA